MSEQTPVEEPRRIRRRDLRNAQQTAADQVRPLLADRADSVSIVTSTAVDNVPAPSSATFPAVSFPPVIPETIMAPVAVATTVASANPARGAGAPELDSNTLAKAGHPANDNQSGMNTVPPRRSRRSMRQAEAIVDIQANSRKEIRAQETALVAQKPRSPLYSMLKFLAVSSATVILLAVVWLVVQAAFKAQTVQPASANAKVEISGRVGSVPVVQLSAPLPMAEAKASVISTGTGKQVAAGQPAVIAVSFFDGKTGLKNPQTQNPTIMTVELTEKAVGKELFALMNGSREGTRFLLTRPANDQKPGTMEIAVFDLLASQALGTVQPEAADLPPVGDQDGVPTVAVNPQLPVPEPGTTALIVAGAGEQVAPEDSLLVQYLAVDWNTGQVVDTTWNNRVPRRMKLSAVFPALRAGILDQKVGSRVEVFVPEFEGDGKTPLILVVDILCRLP